MATPGSGKSSVEWICDNCGCRYTANVVNCGAIGCTGTVEKWTRAETRRPDFADFAEPFCAGWNAHRANGEVAAESFARVLMDAHENSGPMRAQRLIEAMEAPR